jgi:hypothetical protein
MCLLVKINSDILSKLEIGKVLDMKYYPEDLSQKPAILKTQIMHITLENQGRFKNHYLIGLVILSKNGPHPGDPKPLIPEYESAPAPSE